MRCRFVPVRIAKPCSQNDSIAHIHWNDHLLPSPRTDCTFSQNRCPARKINIIVNTGIAVQHFPFHAAHNLINHCLPVEPRKLLHNLQVMQIVLEQCSFQTGQIIWRMSLFFHLGCFLSFFQIIFCHFHSKVTAARMNHKVERSFTVFVHFNEVIAAAKCSDAVLCLCLLNCLAAAQPAKRRPVTELVTRLSDCAADRHIVANHGIQLLTFKMFCFHSGKRHTAADIHADQIRHQ